MADAGKVRENQAEHCGAEQQHGRHALGTDEVEGSHRHLQKSLMDADQASRLTEHHPT
jgi:hypothetical protein